MSSVLILALLQLAPSRSATVCSRPFINSFAPHITKCFGYYNAEFGCFQVISSAVSYSPTFDRRSEEIKAAERKQWLLTQNCCREFIDIFATFAAGTIHYTNELFIVWKDPHIISQEDQQKNPEELEKQQKLITAANLIPKFCPRVQKLMLHVDFDYRTLIWRRNRDDDDADYNDETDTAFYGCDFFLPPRSHDKNKINDAETSTSYFFTGFPFLSELRDNGVGSLYTTNYNRALLALARTAGRNLREFQISCWSQVMEDANPRRIKHFFSTIVAHCPNLRMIEYGNYQQTAAKRMFEVENDGVLGELCKLKKLEKFPHFCGNVRESIVYDFLINSGEYLQDLLGLNVEKIVADDFDPSRKGNTHTEFLPNIHDAEIGEGDEDSSEAYHLFHGVPKPEVQEDERTRKIHDEANNARLNAVTELLATNLPNLRKLRLPIEINGSLQRMKILSKNNFSRSLRVLSLNTVRYCPREIRKFLSTLVNLEMLDISLRTLSTFGPNCSFYDNIFLPSSPSTSEDEILCFPRLEYLSLSGIYAEKFFTNHLRSILVDSGGFKLTHLSLQFDSHDVAYSPDTWSHQLEFPSDQPQLTSRLESLDVVNLPAQFNNDVFFSSLAQFCAGTNDQNDSKLPRFVCTTRKGSVIGVGKEIFDPMQHRIGELLFVENRVRAFTRS
jgi:hypothetical protein